MAWNTAYHITYQSPDDLSDSIRLIFENVDQSLSPFNSGSTVTAINENTGDIADDYFIAVYNKSRQINAISGGIFDPTVSPLIRAWGFGQGHEVSADTLDVDSVLQHVGINKTRLENRKLVKDDPAIEFNFSAIAKGFGVDCIAEMLERNGVTNYLVEVGGEIRAHGVNPQGEKWRIGIDRPDADAKPSEIVSAISITDCGVATSGNYRNYHESGGRRFGHTISPLTGRPAETDVLSATVIAPTCMEADALATCCMALGSQKALELCNKQKVGVMLILADQSVITNNLFP